jgi:hypothetical protein
MNTFACTIGTVKGGSLFDVAMLSETGSPTVFTVFVRVPICTVTKGVATAPSAHDRPQRTTKTGGRPHALCRRKNPPLSRTQLVFHPPNPLFPCSRVFSAAASPQNTNHKQPAASQGSHKQNAPAHRSLKLEGGQQRHRRVVERAHRTHAVFLGCARSCSSQNAHTVSTQRFRPVG